MPRVAPITGKSDVPAEHHDMVDAVVKVWGGVGGQFSMLLQSPKLAERVLPLVTFFREESVVDAKLRSVAILTAVREREAAYVWAAQVAAARRNGLREEVIDLIRAKGDPAKLAVDERDIVTYVRQLMRTNKSARPVFDALAAAAAATIRLRIATGVCLVVQRDPIQTAKQVASLDQISGGRFLFGVGAGWNAEEMADHGTDFKARFRVMRERVEAMKAIWTKSKPEYDGEFVKFPPMMTWPKPVQKPHPPVIVGGAFPYGARRAIAFGDGWMPHARRPEYGDVLGLLPDFRKLAVEAGRDPATLPITIFGMPEDGELIKRYRDAGVARLVFTLSPAQADEVLPALDRCAALMPRAGASELRPPSDRGPPRGPSAARDAPSPCAASRLV